MDDLSRKGWACVLRRQHNNWGSLLVRDSILAQRPFTNEAREYAKTLRFYVEDPDSDTGGGFWMSSLRLVYLNTAQHEAGIHEIAHAWWDKKQREGAKPYLFVRAVWKLALEDCYRWPQMGPLARQYTLGRNELRRGLFFENGNPMHWEMFAGLASGCMGEIGKLPPYVARFYHGLFTD